MARRLPFRKRGAVVGADPAYQFRRSPSRPGLLLRKSNHPGGAARKDAGVDQDAGDPCPADASDNACASLRRPRHTRFHGGGFR